jgi:lipopolysaccharide export system permease protein
LSNFQKKEWPGENEKGAFMTILDRYITREFLRFFLLVILSFLSLFLIVDFFEKLKMLINYSAPFYQILAFFFFRIPMMLSLTIPAAVLLSSLLTFGSFSKNSEIVAMRASGVSLYRSSIPILLISFLIALFTFVFSELITPYANEKAEYIRKVEIEKKEIQGIFKQEQIWYRGTRGIYNFKLFDPEHNTLRGITLNYMDRKMNLIMRVDAERAVWDRNHWVFYNLLIVRFDSAGFPVMERYGEKILDFPENPSDFRVIQKDSEQMGYFELRKYVQKIRTEGYDATRYLADLHGKIASPSSASSWLSSGYPFPEDGKKRGTGREHLRRIDHRIFLLDPVRLFHVAWTFRNPPPSSCSMAGQSAFRLVCPGSFQTRQNLTARPPMRLLPARTDDGLLLNATGAGA